jgi:hypothetical protein
VNDDEASRGESLEEGTRKANSNLQRLLDAIGGILTASGDLLVRLQQILSGTQPAAGTNGSDKPATPQLPDRCDC